MTWLLVGLGNPGSRYEGTRHNAGFLLLDELAERFHIPLNEKKFDGVYGKGKIWQEPVALLKPQTFMNLSGRSVALLSHYFKISPEQLVVIYDDLDLEPMKVKARVGGSAGGHNGIKSLIQELGTPDFHRLKIGIGKAPGAHAEDRDTTSWVLGKLTDQELLSYQNEVLEQVLLRLKGIFDAHSKND